MAERLQENKRPFVRMIYQITGNGLSDAIQKVDAFVLNTKGNIVNYDIQAAMGSAASIVIFLDLPLQVAQEIRNNPDILELYVSGEKRFK